MWKALAIKELRETVGIGAAGLAVHLAMVAGWIGVPVLGGLGPDWASGGEVVPFVGDGYLSTFILISTVLALALGLRQSVGESWGGTHQFLLHLPATRRAVIGTKLAVGSALVMVVCALPVLIYGWWAATPGTHAGPFQWSMTSPNWQTVVTMPVVYLGTFLTGLRPASWKGTRLLPLFGVGAVVTALQPIPAWWVLGFAMLPLCAGLLIVSILFVARTRDYA